MTISAKKKSLYQINNSDNFYLSWFLLTLFFAMQYIWRIFPNILSEKLYAEFALNGQAFASLGSLYFLSYAFMQIPLGFLADFYGIRIISLFSLTFCAIGAYITSCATSLLWLQVSRVFLGIGSASALMCALKVISDNFPEKQKNLFMGITLAFGTFVAAFSGNLYNIMLKSYDWRHIMRGSIVLIALLMLALVNYLPRKKPRKSEFLYSNRQYKLVFFPHKFPINIKNKRIFTSGIINQFFQWFAGILERYFAYISKFSLILSKKNIKSLLTQIKWLAKIFSHKLILIYSLIAIGLYTPLAVLADLWGSLFLQSAFSLSNAQAGQNSLILYMGLALGSSILPLFCKNIQKIDLALFFSSLFLLIAFAFLIYYPEKSIIKQNTIVFTLIFIGFFSGAEMMCFSAALKYGNELWLNHRKTSVKYGEHEQNAEIITNLQTNEQANGSIIGVVNTLNMLGCSIIQQFIGFILENYEKIFNYINFILARLLLYWRINIMHHQPHVQTTIASTANSGALEHASKENFIVFKQNIASMSAASDGLQLYSENAFSLAMSPVVFVLAFCTSLALYLALRRKR